MDGNGAGLTGQAGVLLLAKAALEGPDHGAGTQLPSPEPGSLAGLGDQGPHGPSMPGPLDCTLHDSSRWPGSPELARSPLPVAQGPGTRPLFTLPPGLNISGRLSVWAREGVGGVQLCLLCWSRQFLQAQTMPVEEFVAGWISGAAGLVLGHPFDTVKVRLQTQTTYRGIADCMVRIYRHESLLGFFKGMSFPIASIAVVNSVLFGVYSNALLLLTATSHQERRAQPPSYMHIFLAGCTGGFLQVSPTGFLSPESHTPQMQGRELRPPAKWPGPASKSPCPLQLLGKQNWGL
ncbi:solute carrier family 25 member 45 isoform X2 [Aotus nancymaae]|uniref:solute carrier family 25 member 45 isoform X2 n=1 Tax=Aotus nancymaae TaxID=37293 RepID=UPI0030FE426D